jgi:hypothetical protein
MRKLSKVAVFGILMSLGAAAYANTISFTYTGSTSASGSIDLTYVSGNQYHITGGSATVTGYSGTFTLMPGGTLNFNSPSGYFFADNLYLNPGNPHFDGAGPLFLNGSEELNIFGNSADNYSLYVWTPALGYATIDTGGTLTVPDGGMTVGLLGLAMVGGVFMTRKLKLA